ncbi:diguanylate cyclase [Mycolicibacterium sp. CBMA 226]|uniref:GGDEF domain-containing protein n=1 Tax=Mycolicibacterium sp. CBMA 226 TaxID=2606611 RepID=UPI0012DF3BC0|nr:GGDEF domain-containing protein [Mycolicibacterium sp. CBMA 226]MUL74876.1 GGDEF domain-containing protein [Mycolicibacterium sp. CBMA 226]
MISILRHWWNRPDQYDLLSAYLSARHLQTFAQLAIALYMGGMGAVTVLVLMSSSAPASPVLRGLSIVFTVGWIISAVAWSIGWPTRRQSLGLIAFIEAGFAYNCLSVTDPRVGLTACTAFAALEALVAFLHTGIHLVITLAIALLTAGVCTFRYAMSGDSAGAMATLITVVFSLLSVPITVKVSMHILGDLAIDSDTDELTGLLNRRGFGRAAEELADSVLTKSSTDIGIIMVDLDRFKLVNDTQGHAAGDRLLIAVGEILVKAASAGESVVARYGGEEFVIAAALGSATLCDVAEKIRADVEMLPDAVTVSVGVSDLRSADPRADRDLLRYLVDGADDAMYRAKHAGGNRVAHHAAQTN